MPRKIFISILGTGYYQETRYSFTEPVNKSDKLTNYVQESTLLQLASDWKKEDRCIVFLTEKARKDNWVSPSQANNKFVLEGKSETYPGLKEIINKNNFGFELLDINIPDGNTEDEIWQIFETVYNELQDGDELYFDVTHAFRSIPMLVMVLINYAKLLKNINVKSITYGNFMASKGGVAPVDNLTSFSQLQDWTNAANLFVNHGNLDALVKLTKTKIAPLAKEAKGTNESITTLQRLSTQLERVSLQMKTNRLPDIISGDAFAMIKKSFNTIQENVISPLTPILNEVEVKLRKFDVNKNTLNGLSAVEFCLESGLIQQAITMLQETIISLSIESEGLEVKDYTNRNLATSIFKILKDDIPEHNWKGVSIENIELTRKLISNPFFNELKSIMDSLSDKRNDINHAGFSLRPLGEKAIKKLNNDILDLLKRTKEKLN